MQPIPKNPTVVDTSTIRFGSLRRIARRARESATIIPDTPSKPSVGFTRRDFNRIAVVAPIVTTLSSAIPVLVGAANTVTPQLGIFLFLHQNWKTLHQISRYTDIGWGYLTYGMGNYELVRPEMLDDEVFRVANAFYNFRHFFSYQKDGKVPSSNELKDLISLLQYTTEEERREKTGMLVNMGLFTREIESDIKYYSKHRPYGEARRLAENRVLEYITRAAEKLDGNISMSKWLIKCIKKHAPHLEAHQSILERIFTEGPDFLGTDPWFQTKRRAELEKLKKKDKRNSNEKKQVEKELTEPLYNYQVQLRSFNPGTMDYDEFVF